MKLKTAGFLQCMAATWITLACGRCVAAQPPEWLTANHVSLRYQLTGHGPDTIVLLQESGLPLEVWDELLPALATRHRTILRYDPRGFGLSEKIRTPVTMAAEVEDLQALLEGLKVHGPVVLVAGALGGSIALSFAATHPEEVRGVLVTSPSALLVAREPRPWIDPVRDPAAAHAAELRTVDVVYPQALRTNSDRWERFLGMMESNDPDSEHLAERLINTTAYADILPKIRCRTLLVATSMFVRPVESVKELAHKIPHGDVVVLNSGHLASFESPDLVAPVVLKFLHQVGS
jgi:3-oxoadipate enol-lactonase